MTKDVLISISGLQMDVLEEEKEYEPIEVVAPANYFLKNGKHYILFDEVTEGIPGITGEDTLEVMKSGVSNVHMVFEKNKKNLTYYQTPYGQLLIGIHTKEMEVEVSEDNINVKVGYILDVNHEPLADCQIRINVKSKDAGDFQITKNMDF